jgi:CPA2 family monovalent cation:H+ antiporter-2
VCIGKTLGASLDQPAAQVAVVSVRRASGQVVIPDENMALMEGDTLVLSGRPQSLSRAESLLLRG